MRQETHENLEGWGLAGVGAVKGMVSELLYKESRQSVAGEPSKSATKGWLALGVGVFAYDMLAPETLSEGVDRGLENHRLLTAAAIGTVAAHLLNVLPEQIDPIQQFAKRTRHRLHN